MIKVTELGYARLGVSNLPKWKRFAKEIIGLEIVEDSEPGRCFLRMDYWHHRIVLEEDGSDDLNVLGFRVAGEEEFHAMAKQLGDAGVKIRLAPPQLADDRHVLELMQMQDGTGQAVEIFHGPQIQSDIPFYPGRRMHGRFKTGEAGLGHVMHCGPEHLDQARKFYVLLGMRGGVEYKMPLPGRPVPLELMFLHCNERDHSVAFGAPGQKRINHLMIEVESIDDVGLAYETVLANGIPVAVTPGRHANDRLYSFYFFNPSGWMCEIGCVCDIGWGAKHSNYQSEYYHRDPWGHVPLLLVPPPEITA